MKTQKVKCQSCGTIAYETTEHYNPNIPLNGSMLKLIEPYFSYNWQTYDGALGCKSTGPSRMLCAWCAGYITTGAKLTLIDEPKSDNVDAPVIGDTDDSALKDDKVKVTKKIRKSRKGK